MARLVVTFDSMRDARDAVNRLNNAHIGIVRTRILDGEESESGSSWMIDPNLGAIQVRPTDDPQAPASMDIAQGGGEQASIPATGQPAHDVQLFIEVDDADEPKARKILGLWGGSVGEQASGSPTEDE